MLPLDTLFQIYLATTVFGWGFIIVCFFMGLGDHGQGGDHGGSGHGDHFDHFDPGHGQTIHLHGHGHGAGDAHAHAVQSSEQSHQGTGDDARTGANVLPSSQRTTGYFKLMGVLNPTSVSVFVGFFGMTGLLLMTLLPFLGYFSCIPAAIAGACAVVVMRNIFAYATARLNVSNSFKSSDAIGQVASVSAPIGTSGVGEVTYIIGNTRFNAAARQVSKVGADVQELKKGSKVMIVDREAHLVVVEPYDD